MTFRKTLVFAALLASAPAAFSCSDDSSDTTTSSNSTSSTGGSGGTSNSGPGPGSSVSTGGDMGVGGGGVGGSGGAAVPMGWVTDPVPVLNNDAACLTWSAITPLPSENGHLYGVRLTPPSYPFTADEIVYELFHDGRECDAGAAHRVEVLVLSDTTPPNDPVNPIALSLPAITLNNPGTRVVTLPLPNPVTLQSGEHLFVGVEMVSGPSMDSLKTCLATCEGATVTDRDWWSNAAAPPYNWATLESFGFSIHARIGANGM